MNHVLETLYILRGVPKYNQWLYSQIRPYLKGTVLDIGSGLGDIAQSFKEHCAVQEVVMSDSCPAMIDYLTTYRLHQTASRVIELDIADPLLKEKILGGWVDTLTCVNVLEHIKNDDIALANIHYLLKQEGKVVIFVPAVQSIFGSLDYHVGHYRRYRRSRLNPKMKAVKLIPLKAFYMNFFGIFTWYLAGCVMKQQRFHGKVCEVLDKIVPLIKSIESVVSIPIGQSLIMVAQKNDTNS